MTLFPARDLEAADAALCYSTIPGSLPGACASKHDDYCPAHDRLAVERVAAAIRDERERAVAVCRDVARQETERTIGRPTSGEYQIGANNCAEAIRAMED